VLAGGRSSEREVSLVSGRGVLAALEARSDALDQRGPARAIAVEILADGRWSVAGEALRVGAALERLAEVDVVFDALHGGQGEDGSVQGLFACAGIPLTGSGVRASALALDKLFARQVAAAHGVRVARGDVLEHAAWRSGREEILARLAGWGVAGWVAKPRQGGSSVGTALARDPAELADAIERAFAEEPEVLVEELVGGVELTGGVVVDGAGVLRALTTIEIRPRRGAFFDYAEKYAEGGAEELCPPVSVPPETAERVRELALLLHRAFRCAGYSRSDFMLPSAGGDPVFLELNTLPGFTPRSLVPLAAAHEGVDYRTLCLWILADALRRSAVGESGP